MSWDSDTAQTRIRLGARKPTDSHSREETPVSCIVRRIRGACFADRDSLLRVARQVLAGGELSAVIVVSARQGVTDQLSGQAQELGTNPAHAARDLLLATGELQSAALLAAAVAQLGGQAEVVPPWSVFETTAEFGNATIEKVEVEPVLRCLGAASCQSCPVSSAARRDGRVTTLGRGGSDYSAVALGVRAARGTGRTLQSRDRWRLRRRPAHARSRTPLRHPDLRGGPAASPDPVPRCFRKRQPPSPAAGPSRSWSVPPSPRDAGRRSAVEASSSGRCPPRARPSPPTPPWAAILNRCLQFFVPGRGSHPSPRSTTSADRRRSLNATYRRR